MERHRIFDFKLFSLDSDFTSRESRDDLTTHNFQGLEQGKKTIACSRLTTGGALVGRDREPGTREV